MRSRSVFVFLCFVLLSCVPAAFAQKRVFATIDPNAAVFNRDATIYDPQTGMLTPAAGDMNVAREQHSAVRLSGGKVLIAGGYNGHYRKDAEIYNPADGSFTAAADLGVARSGAAAVLLQNGTVLVAGGYNGSYLTIAELYDPFSDTFSYASPMVYPRQNPTAVLLSDGQVLVTGGFDGTSGAAAFQNSSELYDPAYKTFALTGYMTDARWGHTATLLSDGKVLVTGGCTNSVTGQVVCDKFLASAEIYDPSTGEFTETGAMNTPRANHTATRLSDGRVLIAGGNDGNSSLASAEIYDPATGTFSVTGDLGTARSGHTSSMLFSGKVLIAGGFSDHQLASAEIFDPATGAFTELASSMAVPRLHHSATVLSDGKVLLAGGQNSSPLTFDVNFQTTSDNIAPNIVFSTDSKVGFVSYTGSGVVLAFSAETGAILERIVTGGKPSVITPLKDGQRLAVVSALDNRIFIIDMPSRTLQSTYTFTGTFGFGSIVSLSPDGNYGYVSSTSTGEVIKFDISTGNEVGRLAGLLAPAQITLTKDGSTLMVVDTGTNDVVFVDSSSMTVKYRMLAENSYPAVSFSIFNKVVLNLDETVGAVASQNYGSTTTYGALIVFDPATAEILYAPRVGISPGLTMLLPSGTEWLVLCKDALSFIPVDDPESVTNVTSVDINMTPGLANMVLSDDNRYAYFTTADTDKIYQHDIDTHAVVGSFLVGDDPDVSLDQPMSLAFTPDYKTMVSLNFASNQLDLLTDTAILKQTKFLSLQDKFTGLSIINLSDTENAVIVSAIGDGGVLYSPDNAVNPATVWLGPNSQSALDVSALFNFDNALPNLGHLIIESLQPIVAAYSSLGQVHPNFLTPYLSSMQAIPFYPDYRKSLHDWIIPEIPISSAATAEFSLVNPNYNPSPYVVTHYGTDGTMLETSSEESVAGSARLSKSTGDFVTTTQVGGVLIFGGEDPPNTSNTADIFSPSTNGFAQAYGYSPTRRYGHTAVLLPTGKIFIAGGKNGSKILKSAQLYDPVEETFSYTPGTMISERYRHTATLLSDGRVLLAGGQNSISINNTAELYDPFTGSFTSTAGPMVSYRDAHTATLLPDGKVLLAGGLDGMAVTAAAEIYDPATSKFYPTGSMNAARAFHTAVLLGNGNVLIAGGYNGSYLASAEIYNPSTGVFTPTASMGTERSQHTATLLSDGTVLIAGGTNSTGPLNSAELYDPETGSFVETSTPMRAARRSHTATLLEDDPDGNNDRVLITGGFGYATDLTGDESSDIELTTLATGELYTPQGRDFSPASLPMAENRQEHTATLMEGSKQGYLRGTSDKGLLVTEIYNNDGGKDTSVNAIDVDDFSGITRIYSPLFVFSPPYMTLVNVINANGDSGAIVTLTLHAANGATLGSPKTTILRPNAQLKGNLWQIFGYDPVLQNQSGWLEVSSSVDRVVGTLSLTDSENDFLVTFQLSGIPLQRFVYPLVSEDSTFGTGIALLNDGDQPAHVELELWSVEGTLDQSQSITLNPGTRISMLTSQLFPGMQPRRSGNVRVYSDQPLHGMGTMFDWELHFILSVPPVSIPEP